MYHRFNAYHKRYESRCLLGLLALFFSLARFHQSSEVMYCEQFPTTPCNVQGQLGLLKGITMRQLTKRIKEQ